MVLDKIADKIIETEVMIMGGGIAGCYAAAKAAEHGLNVTLVEKAKTDRSGSAAMGMDHYEPVMSGGITPVEFIKLWEERQHALNGDGRFTDPNVVYQYIDKSLWALEESEKLGVTMKWDDGEYYFMPQAWFGGPRLMLRVHWQDIKPKLAKAVRERGVNVLERTMIVDLLTNKGAVVGATAINTRTGEFIVIKANAVVIATGIFARCYEPETPLFYKYQMKYHWCPASISGDGYAVAYRAGVDVANMDITGWGLRIRDDLCISYGNFDHGDGIRAKWYTWDGEEIPYPHAYEYRELELKGKDPIYVSLEHLPEDYHKRMQVAFVDEKLVSFKIAEERGFNPKTHRYELMENHPLNFMVPTGVNVDENFKSSLQGLYAIGDCSNGAHGCGNAAVGGLIVGDNIHNFVNGAGEPVIDEAQVESQKQVALAPLTVKDGVEPMELECCIRYICTRYVGMFKSEGRLLEGKRRLGSLRRVFLSKQMAKNPHYLMRGLECRNIMDLVGLHLDACLIRKETRGQFIRLDYPEKDPSRDNMITIQRLEKGKPVLEIRKVPELKREYAKEGK
ncbi:FAD-dependent oxidoreductase [Candidatus Bathyarchaeota archaeon]|nr:FAD-dependent oxidoreductase [Candidatus Bathyarchaeota archaeon]